ncbi:MAG: ATP-binding protein [Pseudonocardiaceae bacterium]
MAREVPGSKRQRDQLRATMLEQGCTFEQIAAVFAKQWGFRPRQAWRHAYGWTQEHVADLYNQQLNNGQAPMNGKRIGDYENWPDSPVKPNPKVLHMLAKIYSTSAYKLVDPYDRQKMDADELIALEDLGCNGNDQSKQDQVPSVVSSTLVQKSTHTPRSSSSVEQGPPGSIRDQIMYAACRSLRHVESGYPVYPQQIPLYATTFVNRHAEIRRLDTLVNEEDEHANALTTSKIMVIAGPPGVGKSALLVHWAVRVKRHFPDGQLYVDLRGYSLSEPLLPEHALDGFLRSLGVPATDIPSSLDGQSSLFRSLTAGQRLLVLIDNVDTSDRVRPLLTGPGPACVLLTSRNRLPGLAVREGAYPMTLAMLSPEDAERLLRGILGAERVTAESGAVSEICRLCGYLPLALRIVAERAAARPELSLQELVEELSEESERLDILTTTDDETSAIRHSFSWSYHSLTVDAAMVFRLLGLHTGPDISREALAALTGMPPASLRRAVDSLVNAHLVQETTSHRLTIHDLLHSYAREIVETDEPEGSRHAALWRLGTWYSTAAIAADRYLTPGFTTPLPPDRPTVQTPQFDNFDQALQWFEAERANLLAYVQNSQQSEDFEAAVIITRASWGFFNTRKYWSDWIECDKAGLAASRTLNDKVNEAWILTSLGVAYRNLRRTDEAIECHQQAASLFREHGEFNGAAFAQQNLANAQSDSGNYQAALDNYQAALETFQELPDGLRGQSVVLLSMGTNFNCVGRFNEAIDYAVQGGTLCEELHDQHGAAIALHIQGAANLGLDNIDTAITQLREALGIRILIKDRYGQARSLDALGDALNRVNRTAEAIEAWVEALTIFRDIEAPEAADLELKLPSPPIQ